VNIDYWFLFDRPGLWFGLGSSISLIPNLSPLDATVKTVGANTVATVVSKGWLWSNAAGHLERMTSRDIMFWLNMDKATGTHSEQQLGNVACGYVPGFGLPGEALAATASGQAVHITFKGHENSFWILYNQISQIDPMPYVWDINHNGGAPGSGGCSTELYSHVKTNGTDPCVAVFTYLNGLQINNALWQWADGPYRQQSAGYSSGKPTGNNVLVANNHYSDTLDKVHAVKRIVYFPEATTAAEFAQLQDYGHGGNQITFGYADGTDVQPSPGVGKAGNNIKPNMQNYKTVGSVDFGAFYFMFNYDNAHSTYQTTGPLPLWAKLNNQLYFRQAMQEAINQPGIIAHRLNGYSLDTYSAVPVEPPNKYSKGIANPFPFSPANAKALLKAHGWDSTPATKNTFPAVCDLVRPNGCGSQGYAIPKGSQLTFTGLFPTGDSAFTNQIGDEATTLAAAGINMVQDWQPASTVAPDCFGGAGLWEVCGYGGWLYAPDYFPSGEVLFGIGAGSNSGGYANAEMNGLLHATTDNGKLALNAVSPVYHTSYAEYTATDLPFLWQPTPAGFTEQLRSVQGALPNNPIGDFNPEFITAI
jgi:peptide/nickel transport system substrate-binding protein